MAPPTHKGALIKKIPYRLVIQKAQAVSAYSLPSSQWNLWKGLERLGDLALLEEVSC